MGIIPESAETQYYNRIFNYTIENRGSLELCKANTKAKISIGQLRQHTILHIYKDVIVLYNMHVTMDTDHHLGYAVTFTNQVIHQLVSKMFVCCLTDGLDGQVDGQALLGKLTSHEMLQGLVIETYT